MLLCAEHLSNFVPNDVSVPTTPVDLVSIVMLYMHFYIQQIGCTESDFVPINKYTGFALAQ